MPTIIRHGQGRRYSRIVVHNGTAYFSGLTAVDGAGDVRTQTRETLAKADELLAVLKAHRADILSATVWLRDISDFAQMNEVWEEWIDAENPPARATVEARLAAPDLLVEIKFTVAVDAVD